jgi:hypothetical protein
MEEVIDARDHLFTLMLLRRRESGHAIENIRVIRKDGGLLPCQMTSVEFTGDLHIRKAISTLVDLSAGMRLLVIYFPECLSDASSVSLTYRIVRY